MAGGENQSGMVNSVFENDVNENDEAD